MTEQTERVWYRAKLLPGAQSIFTDSFYPEPKRTGAQYVYFTQIDVVPEHPKILVASRFAQNSFRMLTFELAKFCLEPKEKATKAEMNQLNELSHHLDRNL